jgi:hypothetical protein
MLQQHLVAGASVLGVEHQTRDAGDGSPRVTLNA